MLMGSIYLLVFAAFLGFIHDPRNPVAPLAVFTVYVMACVGYYRAWAANGRA
jgi:hypothetical protein